MLFVRTFDGSDPKHFPPSSGVNHGELDGAYAVVLPNVGAYTLAHELGHYLGLRHTHPDFVGEIAAANDNAQAAALKQGTPPAQAKHTGHQACLKRVGELIDSKGFASFDNDWPAVKDTPADPGPPLFQPSGSGSAGTVAVAEEECAGPGRITVQVNSRTFDTDSRKWVTSTEDYTFAPDRTNIMSYFLACSTASQHVSPDQISVVRHRLQHDSWYHLILGQGWSGWNRLEGATIVGAPTVVSRQPTIVDLYGRGTDNHLWQNSWSSHSGWNGWSQVDAELALGTAPVVDSMGPDHVHVFACALGSGEVFQKTWTQNQGWSTWQPREGGTLSAAPTVVSRQPSIIDLFGRGMDKHLWQNSSVAPGEWTGWFRVDASLTLGSAPVVDSMGPEHLQIFACEETTGKVFQKTWAGGWGDWHQREGAVLKDSPTVVSRGGKIVDLLGRGTDNRLWHEAWTANGGWTGWFPHDQSLALTSSPVVDSMNPDHLHVFARDANGFVRTKWWVS